MTTTQRYCYDDLRLPNSIRLLRLKPGFDSEPISCSLLETSLDDIPSYEAISYTWGDATIREDVLCDNHPLSVTRNLADALRRMRLKHVSRLLWADAICINQSNIEERSRQVSIMRKIYGSASRVLVWLGPATEDSDLAFNFIELLAGLQCDLTDSPAPVKCTENELDSILDAHIDSNQYYETFAVVSVPDRLSIMNFFRRSWFRRVWVIQEVTRGTAVTVLCGDRTMNWKAFALGVRVIGVCVRMNQLWPVGQIDHDTEVGIIHICSTLSKLSWLRQLNFADILHYASNYDATDARDMIYALLGCSSNEIVNRFPVDYHESMPEIMARIAPILYHEKGSLDPLVYASHEEEIPTNRPSWTPDLEAMRSLPPIITPDPQTSQSRYKDTKADFMINETDLAAQGRLVGSIGRVSAPTSTKLEDYELWQWSPKTLDWAVRTFVLGLDVQYQPQALRSLVRACTLGRGSSFAGDSVDADEECDAQARLFLAAIFYYSDTNTPPPAPSYLGIRASDEWQTHLEYSREGGEVAKGYTVYEQYNINDQYDPEASASDNAVRQKVVFDHYEINDTFDEADLDRFQRHMFEACTRRRLFVMSEDETVIGIGPGAVEAGDIVVQLDGTLAPFILRPCGVSYKCVGECFIHGEMPGSTKVEGCEISYSEMKFTMC